MNIVDTLKDHDRVIVIARYKRTEQVDISVFNGCPPPQNPSVFVQMCLAKNQISPSGNLIRLGEFSGDEVRGWTHVDALEIVEILGELSQDNVTVNPIQNETLKLKELKLA